MSDKQWTGSTYGHDGMHSALIRSLYYINPKLLYIISYLFIVPVCVICNNSRRTSYRFFRERLGFGRVKSAWNMYVNHCRFAEVVIDRFAMYAGRHFDVTVDGLEYFQRLASRDDGFLHLSSHIGNYEISGYSLVSDRKTIHAVVFQHEKESVMRNRNNMFVKTNVKMIALKENNDHLFEIDEAICNGDIVSFPSDRFIGQAKYLEREFLGAKAKFPQGPFRVAAMRGLDVLGVNVMKEGWGKYRVFVRPLEYDKTAPRKDQMEQLSHSYTAELENRIRQYPTQWYNFYDFWR